MAQETGLLIKSFNILLINMKPFFYSVLIYLSASCSSNSLTQPSTNNVTEGCVLNKMSKYSNDQIPGFVSLAKTWFRNNELIQEVKRVHFHTDTNNVQTVSDILQYYTYINYDTHTFSLYHNFSDTAKPFNNYFTLDSLFKKGTSDFFKLSQSELPDVLKIEKMSDTIINSINYERKKYLRKKRGEDYASVIYFRCDTPMSKFSFFRNIIDSCSPLKIFDYNANGVLENSNENDFISFILSENEKKVFSAWEKNNKE